MLLKFSAYCWSLHPRAQRRKSPRNAWFIVVTITADDDWRLDPVTTTVLIVWPFSRQSKVPLVCWTPQEVRYLIWYYVSLIPVDLLIDSNFILVDFTSDYYQVLGVDVCQATLLIPTWIDAGIRISAEAAQWSPRRTTNNTNFLAGIRSLSLIVQH